MRIIRIAAVIVSIILGVPLQSRLEAQSGNGVSKSPQWQIDAGGKMEFEVVSVKQNTATPSAQTVRSNIPLGPQDLYTPTGGLLSATNFPLIQYMIFAYKLTPNQTR